MSERLERRIERLKAQMAKLGRRIETLPENPRAAQWKARWLECRRCLEAIRDTGKETIGAAPACVDIDVPATPFAVQEA